MKMRCTGAVYVVGRGIVTENEVVDLDEESLKDARVSAHFVPVRKRVRSGNENVGAGASEQNLPGLEPAGEGGAGASEQNLPGLEPAGEGGAE